MSSIGTSTRLFAKSQRKNKSKTLAIFILLCNPLPVVAFTTIVDSEQLKKVNGN